MGVDRSAGEVRDRQSVRYVMADSRAGNGEDVVREAEISAGQRRPEDVQPVLRHGRDQSVIITGRADTRDLKRHCRHRRAGDAVVGLHLHRRNASGRGDHIRGGRERRIHRDRTNDHGRVYRPRRLGRCRQRRSLRHRDLRIRKAQLEQRHSQHHGRRTGDHNLDDIASQRNRGLAELFVCMALALVLIAFAS